jgi:hypothetical protein
VRRGGIGINRQVRAALFPFVRVVAYFSGMRKRLAIVASVLSLALLAPLSAEGVEYGQDATGDPNAIRITGTGSSAFLYSDRIVFTAAHVVDVLGDNFVKDAYLFAPGVKSGPDQKRYLIQKVLKAPTYRARVGTDNTRIDDFAIIILRESMPVRNIVQVASLADIESFIREKAPVEMVGYGFQNVAMRKDGQAWNTMSPHKMTSVLVSGDDLRKYYNAYPTWHQPNQTFLDFGIPNNEKDGSVCDGDSGAGFFVQKGNVRYYIGAVGGLQAGITNCNAPLGRFAPNGGMSGVNPAYKHLALIKEAEDFVANEKKLEAAKEEARVAAELKAKQEAEEKARVEAELKAKLEAEAKIAAEAAAKVAADAALLAATKKSQDLVKKLNVGKSCAKLKSTKAVSGVKFVCVKKGKKLVWALS